jgi:AmmeMemoRadiSam system protein B
MKIRERVLPRGWYPTSGEKCRSDILGFIEGFVPPEGKWMGGVIPHAGWYFSGRPAARVIKTLSAGAKPDLIVIFGGHLSGGSPPIAYTEDFWETPFGPQAMDSSFANDLVTTGAAAAARESFGDNTVEIQIPFIKFFFKDVPIVAIHSPASSRALELAGSVCSLLERRNLNAVFIGSADLTHYGPNYGFIPQGTGQSSVRWVKEENDRSLIDKALLMDAEGVLKDASAKHNTCSAGPIASVIAAASSYGINHGRLLEYFTSYDVMQDLSFVGYAGILY